MMANNVFSHERISETAFFTGHRNLSNEDVPVLRETVFQCLYDAYAAGYRRFLCGCALGFDTLAAFQTVRLRELYPDVLLSLAIPCADQPKRWPVKDQDTYRTLLSAADDKIILSPVYYEGVMLTRNRYMADRSSLCICLLRNMQGGTASTVRYALTRKGMKIINLAVPQDHTPYQMREKAWNYMYISRSAGRSADTVHLHLSPSKKLTSKHI